MSGSLQAKTFSVQTWFHERIAATAPCDAIVQRTLALISGLLTIFGSTTALVISPSAGCLCRAMAAFRRLVERENVLATVALPIPPGPTMVRKRRAGNSSEIDLKRTLSSPFPHYGAYFVQHRVEIHKWLALSCGIIYMKGGEKAKRLCYSLPHASEGSGPGHVTNRGSFA